MKQGRSLGAVVAEIERQTTTKKDYIADTRQIELWATPASVGLTLDGQDYRFRDLALRQAGARVGIPARYLDKMAQEAPELLVNNLRHWFDANPERRLIRTLDGGARAFLSDRYARIDNLDVAEIVLPILRELPQLRLLSTEITETRLYIKASTASVTAEVKSRRIGDVVEAGFIITNSEVGLGAVSVRPFAHFLVCLNGMVRDGGARWAHLGRHAEERDEVYALLTDETREADDRALLLKVRDTVRAAIDPVRFNAWVGKLNDATEKKITGDVPKVVEVLAERIGLSSGERGAVLRHLIEGADLSLYGLTQAVTRAAADVDAYDRATELEAAGGTILDLTDWRQLAEAA